MIRVARVGSGFAVLVDGVVTTPQRETRGEAIKDAIKLKEGM